MKLKDFITNFDFSEVSPTKLSAFSRSSLMPIENPRLFTVGCNASFNRKIERTIFIHGLLQTEISTAIDAIYEKLEQRVKQLKAAQKPNEQFFIDVRVSFTIKQEEKPRFSN